MKKNASTVNQTKHTLLLQRDKHHIQNGITIPSKKVVGYVEDVTDTLCTQRTFLQFMFAEVFV